MQFLSQLPNSISPENTVEVVSVTGPGKSWTDAFARERMETADAKLT
jgi:hypothetical protein